MRPRVIAAMIAATLLLAACSDLGAPSRMSPPSVPATSLTPTQLDELAQSLIDALFPNGLETAAGTRWENVKRKVAEDQFPVAETMYRELVRWILSKQGTMDAPPNGELREHATARLIAAMSAYLYGGESPIDLGSLTGDVVVGIASPLAPGEIVTPTKNAGIEFEEGTFPVETVVIIAENTTQSFSAVCSGPLLTELCQYPLFYRFEPYPYRTLLKPARFGVCHVNTGDYAPPAGIHDRFRLAHTKPSDPANLMPGSVIPEGENIEILPLVQLDFLDCGSTSYTPPAGPIGARNDGLLGRTFAALGNVFESAARLLTPKDAYAVDLGGGGEAVAFSDFNIVDPVRRDLIDFETLPGRVSLPVACEGLCSITNEYANVGVSFDFIRETDGAALGYVTMRRGGPNANGDANNHDIVNSQVFETSGGFWTGTMIMRFPANPTSVRYLLRVNNTSGPVTINAFGPDGETPIPSSQITRSNVVTFPRDCVACVVYREETITVTNAAGISRLQMPGGAYLLAVDDMLIGPPPTPPGVK